MAELMSADGAITEEGEVPRRPLLFSDDLLLVVVDSTSSATACFESDTKKVNFYKYSRGCRKRTTIEPTSW